MKTAVEWLVDALNKEMGLISFVPNADEEYKKELFNIIQQAKEMEEEQLKDAYLNGRYDADKIVMSDKFYAEQYYNETFKQQ
jgi:hypothetical protein